MTEKSYAVSYAVTDEIIALAVEVGELAGVVALTKDTAANSILCRESQLRSIHSTLAADGNSLSLKKVKNVIEGKNVPGNPNEIREVQNACGAYSLMPELNPFSVEDILSVHKTLMTGLTKEAGKFRSGGVELFAEERPVQTAPPAIIVPKLMYDLVNWAETSEAHPLIKSCVFHYEFNFIHPFVNGNSRMGRIWQMLLLRRWKPFFACLPVEAQIYERRKEYYDILAIYDKGVDSTAFIEFMLRAVRDALREFQQTERAYEQAAGQIKRLLTVLGKETLSSRELMARLKLKHRPTFRDNYLLPALSFGLVEMTVPDKPNSSHQRYRAVKKPTA